MDALVAFSCTKRNPRFFPGSLFSNKESHRDIVISGGEGVMESHLIKGDHNPNDDQMVESFRSLLLLHGQLPPKHSDYNTLLRFLRRMDFDLEKAKDKYLNYLKWRVEFGADMISKEFKFEEYTEVKKFYPHGFHGVDKSGKPIYIERIGMIDLNAFLKLTTIERYVKHHISEQEKTLSLRYPACSIASGKPISYTTTILDVAGVGMSNFSKPARCLFMEIQKIDSNYYPETLHRLFIINANSGFKMLWPALRAFIDARTLAKVQVLGSNYLSEIIEVIDPSNLPTFLGGNCTCSSYGGCLFSDKGPWNDPKIIEKLQGASVVEETLGGREIMDKTSKHSLSKQNEESGKNISLQKFLTLEAAVKETQKKIEAMEATLYETKRVLKGLAEIIEELRV